MSQTIPGWATRARVLGMDQHYVAGLDLGQKQDHSAIAVIEKTRVVYDQRDPVSYNFLDETRCVLRHVERMPLGLTWADIAGRTRVLLNRIPDPARLNTVVDGTGVGSPVVEMLRTSGLPGALTSVVITGGDRVTSDGRGYRVPKRDLITGLQVAFENRELELARGIPTTELFLGELMSMRVAVTANGHEQFGVWRSGGHDDLVLAVALAWWKLTRHHRQPIWIPHRLI